MYFLNGTNSFWLTCHVLQSYMEAKYFTICVYNIKSPETGSMLHGVSFPSTYTTISIMVRYGMILCCISSVNMYDLHRVLKSEEIKYSDFSVSFL